MTRDPGTQDERVATSLTEASAAGGRGDRLERELRRMALLHRRDMRRRVRRRRPAP